MCRKVGKRGRMVQVQGAACHEKRYKSRSKSRQAAQRIRHQNGAVFRNFRFVHDHLRSGNPVVVTSADRYVFFAAPAPADCRGMVGRIRSITGNETKVVAHFREHWSQFDQSVRNIFAQTENETQRKQIRSHVPGGGTDVSCLDPVSGNEPLCTDGIQGFQHIFLPPVQRKGRNDQVRTQRRKNRNNRVHGIGSLDADDMVCGQTNGVVKCGKPVDFPVSFGIGQTAWFAAGPGRTVRRIDQRQPIRMLSCGCLEEFIQRYIGPGSAFVILLGEAVNSRFHCVLRP